MSVKVEKTENKNELKLEFTVEAKVFDAGIKKVFEKNAKYFNIPGFRKGKAPMNIVEKFYGDEIFYEDAFNEVVPEVYDAAIKEEKLEEQFICTNCVDNITIYNSLFFYGSCNNKILAGDLREIVPFVKTSPIVCNEKNCLYGFVLLEYRKCLRIS